MAKNTNTDSAAEKSAKNRLAVINAIAALEEKIARDYEKNGKYNEESNKQLEKAQRNLVKIDKFLNGNNQKIKDGIDLYKESANSISSMSSMMGGLKDELQKTTEFGIQFSKSIANTAGRNKGVFQDSNKLLSEMTSLTSELAQLNQEDAVEIASKSNELSSLYTKLSNNISELERKGGRMSKSDQELLRILKERFEVTKGLLVQASQFANLSKLTKEIYEELGSDLEGLEKTFKKIAITTQIFFSSFKNALGVSLFFVGGLVDDFNELSKGIGGTVTQMFQLKAQSFAVSKILGDEAGAAVTSLAEKLGNANEVTLGTSIAVGTIANRLGVSGDEAATLVNQFGNLSGLSNSTAMNTMEAASQLASANGVAPANVMKDIAENTEFFALYAKDGGANIAQAAIEARRLGVDLSTAAKISDNLLDYQSSVASEMQASVLLGRNLNLSKARELAYAGDSVGAMKEALNAAGGIEKFNKMDVYQKKAVAEALGTSVSELQQMSANMEKAATPAGKLQESFNATTAFVQEMGAGIAGTAVKGIGGMLIGMKDFKGQVSDAKEGFDFMKDSVKGIGTFLSGGKGAGFTGLLDTKETGAIKSLGKGGAITPPTPGSSETATKSASSISKIDTKALLRGAGALLVMAAALYVTAKALQEFNTVKPDSLLKAGAALLGLGLAMIGLNYALAPIAATGILELVAGSMLAFGGALALAGLGAKLFGEGFSLVSVALPSIVEQLSSLSQVNFLPIFGMAAALTALGTSLALVATTGLAALPVLAGIGLAAGAVGMMFGGEERGGGSDLLLEEIKGLRHDIQTQPITVQLDGRQVYISNLRQAKNKSN
jgi:hypothetical protein